MKSSKSPVATTLTALAVTALVTTAVAQTTTPTPTPAPAPVAPATSYTVRAYVPGGNLAQTLFLDPAVFQCNNPTFVLWDDPTTPGKVCIHDPANRELLFPSLTVGTYELTVTAKQGEVEGEPSDRSQFAVVPPKVLGVKLGRR
jgi:hypothetical protein